MARLKYKGTNPVFKSWDESLVGDVTTPPDPTSSWSYGQGEIFNNSNNWAAAGSHAEGKGTCAAGQSSHAEGYNTKTYDYYAHAEGYQTYAGYGGHAEGQNTTAAGYQCHAEGQSTYTGGNYCHAEGQNCTALSTSCHAEGQNTYAGGNYCHTEGYGTCTTGSSGHAEGEYCKALGWSACHVEGSYTCAGSYSHSEGYHTYANYYAHSEGYYTSAGIDGSSAAHSEGYQTCSCGYGHSEGYTSYAGYASHSEGYYTFCMSSYSHTEGYYTTCKGNGCHAEGYYTYVGGHNGAHAEGYHTCAMGEGSHAGGQYGITYGKYSFCHGEYVETKNVNEIALGAYNISVDNGSSYEAYNGSISYYYNVNYPRVVKYNGKIYNLIATTPTPAGPFDPTYWEEIGSYSEGQGTIFSIGNGHNSDGDIVRSNLFEIYDNGTAKLDNKNIIALAPPSADGTYTLKCTVSSGVPTYSWVAG